MKVTDETRMPPKFKAHAGKKIKDVPAGYLDWCMGQDWFPQDYPEFVAYCEENAELLQKEMEENGDL